MTLTILLFFRFLFFAPEPANDTIPKSIYDFKVAGLEGGTIDFAKFKGKKILIVNTASECGYTPQYEGLEKLYETHKDKLVIVGFPANDFGAQEPGSNQEIAGFCKKNYGVTFPMAAKITVKGDDKAAIYEWLTNKDYNHFENSTVKWNFQKYLINEKGELTGIYYSKVKPDDPQLLRAIEE